MKNVSLGSYLPDGAVDYCQKLYQTHRFDFFLSRPRRTRLGDFTVKPGIIPRITVNINLNPYSFLITYLHEVAHCVVHYKYKGRGRRKVAPHGPEWKYEFRELLLPVMNESIFPGDILAHLLRYAQNPAASTENTTSRN
jgi:hypothetical protein